MICKLCGQKIKNIKYNIIEANRYYKQMRWGDETKVLLYFKAGSVSENFGGCRMEKGIMFYSDSIKIDFMSCSCDKLIIDEDDVELVKKISKKEFNQAIKKLELNYKKHIKMALNGKRYENE